jgi:uncharacterized protein YndB with AHSA1/START domain
MDKPKFVYVSYIGSTPEKVWDALINPEITRQYWMNIKNVSDWKVGSRWQHCDYDNPSNLRIVGKVIECNPPQRLVVSWVPPAEEGNEAKTSRVSFDIEPFKEGVVRLTVTHDELEPDSEMLHSVSFGWPAVISALKTLLETGKLGAMAGQK